MHSYPRPGDELAMAMRGVADQAKNAAKAARAAQVRVAKLESRLIELEAEVRALRAHIHEEPVVNERTNDRNNERGNR